jgi:hypothetical protein
MKSYRHRQSVNRAGEPLVGGEPAHRIFAIVRSFPLSVSHAGGVRFDITATGADLAMFERAYAWIEMEFLAHEAKCGQRASHATLDVEQYRYIVLNELMFWAMFALQIMPDDPLWGPLPKNNLFGAPPNGVCMVCGPLPARRIGQNQPLFPRQFPK